MGAGTSTVYIYTVSFAVAFGEGPAIIQKIWGDAKLIYKLQSAATNFNTIGAVPVWDPTVSYLVDDMVRYPTSTPGIDLTYQAVLANIDVIPAGANLYWELQSEYPAWQSGVVYQPGATVDWYGQVYVANTTNPGGNPSGNPNWVPLQQYYGSPTMYPGDELQLPDPTIQAAMGVANTPAFRGLCYAVWHDFPLANFGNRIPNIRAQIVSTRTNNLLLTA